MTQLQLPGRDAISVADLHGAELADKALAVPHASGRACEDERVHVDIHI